MISIKPVDREVILPLISSFCNDNSNLSYFLREGGDTIGTIHVGFFADNDELAGCFSLSVTAKKHFEAIPQYRMDGIFVKEKFRKQGIGFALIKMAEFISLNNQVECLWVAKTPQLESFFVKQGFQIFKPENDAEVLVKYPEEHCCASCSNCSQNSICKKPKE